MDTLLQVLEKEPVPVRQLNPAVPRDLETICLKCLEKEPARRYGSARELAEDLARFLDGRADPGAAGLAGERVVKWVRRRPAIAAMAAGIVIQSRSPGSIGITWQWRTAVLAQREEHPAGDRPDVRPGRPGPATRDDPGEGLLWLARWAGAALRRVAWSDCSASTSTPGAGRSPCWSTSFRRRRRRSTSPSARMAAAWSAARISRRRIWDLAERPAGRPAVRASRHRHARRVRRGWPGRSSQPTRDGTAASPGTPGPTNPAANPSTISAGRSRSAYAPDGRHLAVASTDLADPKQPTPAEDRLSYLGPRHAPQDRDRARHSPGTWYRGDQPPGL